MPWTVSLNKGTISIHTALSSWSDSHPKASPSAAVTLGLRTSIRTLGPHLPIQSTVRSSLKNQIWKKKGERRKTSLWDAKANWVDDPQNGPNMPVHILHLPWWGLLLPQLCPLSSACPASTDPGLEWLLKQIFVQSLKNLLLVYSSLTETSTDWLVFTKDLRNSGGYFCHATFSKDFSDKIFNTPKVILFGMH